MRRVMLCLTVLPFRFLARIRRAARGYFILNRSWHVAWIMAERV